MGKKLKAVLLCVLLVFCMAGCNFHSNVAFTYNVDTGDSIKVKLDTSDKYKLSSKLPFTISKDGETLSRGKFITTDGYQQYVGLVDGDEKSTLLDSGEKDGNQYIFWNFDDSEYNYVVLVGGSNTAVIITNNVSEESARECFDRLTISKE